MKNNKIKIGFNGYTDAPPEIEKEMARAKRIKDFLPLPVRTVTEKEREQTSRAWKRYRIKDHERGHRPPLSKKLREPTVRLDTSIILPQSVFNWVKRSNNKAAFIRDIMIKSYEKAARSAFHLR
jgi:hypothetical protein